MNRVFDKYAKRGPDYHFRQIDRSSLFDFSAPVEARFQSLAERVALIAGDKDLSLLDVGCGDGVALSLLAKRCPNLRLFGVEPAQDALTVAKIKIPNAELKLGSAEKLPFEDSFFDIVISSDVIEHVKDPDAMLKEIGRVSKIGATIIVGTPVRHSKFPFDQNHVQEFFIEDYKEMCGRYFSNVEVVESHELSLFLRYNRPPKSFFNFHLLINVLILLGYKNPFLLGRRSPVDMFAYMNAICKK